MDVLFIHAVALTIVVMEVAGFYAPVPTQIHVKVMYNIEVQRTVFQYCAKIVFVKLIKCYRVLTCMLYSVFLVNYTSM